VFLASAPKGVPLALTQFVKHNQVLHQRVVLATVVIEEAPRIADEERAEVIEVIEGITRVILHFGFMQYPTIAEGLALASSQGKLPGIDLSDVTYYIGRETIISSEDIPGMWVWRETLFAFLQRNAERSAAFFRRAGRTGRRIRHRARNLETLPWRHRPRGVPTPELRVVRWSRRSRGGVPHSPAGHRDRWSATREAKGRSGHHFPRLLWAPRPVPGFRACASFGADGARRVLTLNDAPSPYSGGSSRTTSSTLSLGSMLVALDRASTRLKISGGIMPESLVGVG
jgi:hypothetical protein